MLDWISALSNPQAIVSIYGEALPDLGGNRIEEVGLRPDGPTLRVRFDLAEFPIDPPGKWLRESLDVAHVEIYFGGLREISISKFTVDSICDLKIRKDEFVRFSGESESVNFSGVSDTARILRVSAYAASNI